MVSTAAARSWLPRMGADLVRHRSVREEHRGRRRIRSSDRDHRAPLLHPPNDPSKSQAMLIHLATPVKDTPVAKLSPQAPARVRSSASSPSMARVVRATWHQWAVPRPPSRAMATGSVGSPRPRAWSCRSPTPVPRSCVVTRSSASSASPVQTGAMPRTSPTSTSG